MASDQRVLSNLSGRGASRLKFISQPSLGEDLYVPCRLPGCAELVRRKQGAGRSRWFHDRKCLDDFRTRRSALDAAISELASRATDDPLPGARELAGIRSDLDWLLDVRSTYVTPGEWRDTTLPDETSQMPDLEYIRYVQDIRSPSDPCPTCEGTGDLKDHRSPTPTTAQAKQRERVDLLASLVPKLKRLSMMRPSVRFADALDAVHQDALQAEKDLLHLLASHQAGE